VAFGAVVGREIVGVEHFLAEETRETGSTFVNVVYWVFGEALLGLDEDLNNARRPLELLLGAIAAGEQLIDHPEG
jgi:hypothetical protein